jgi:hypothetical protein
MQRKFVPDVYEIPGQRLGRTLPWLTALAIAAMVIGATTALVLAN